jgi:hypothetical protein
VQKRPLPRKASNTGSCEGVHVASDLDPLSCPDTADQSRHSTYLLSCIHSTHG